MARRSIVAVVLLVLAVAGYVLWHGRQSDERKIRSALTALADEFNASTADGLGTVARAAQLGSYFSDDVVVDLGPGTAPIERRDTLIGMAARLQPRTSAFRVALDDVDVKMAEGNRDADVTLTVSFIPRSIATGEQSIDAREFALVMMQSGGTWRIARATAVDTLR